MSNRTNKNQHGIAIVIGCGDNTPQYAGLQLYVATAPDNRYGFIAKRILQAVDTGPAARRARHELYKMALARDYAPVVKVILRALGAQLELLPDGSRRSTFQSRKATPAPKASLKPPQKPRATVAKAIPAAAPAVAKVTAQAKRQTQKEMEGQIRKAFREQWERTYEAKPDEPVRRLTKAERRQLVTDRQAELLGL